MSEFIYKPGDCFIKNNDSKEFNNKLEFGEILPGKFKDIIIVKTENVGYNREFRIDHNKDGSGFFNEKVFTKVSKKTLEFYKKLIGVTDVE